MASQADPQLRRCLTHLQITVLLYSFSIFIVLPSLTDVTMAALCPGSTQCSLAIYLTGLQQAATGLGSLFAMPLLGNLSDRFGRKQLLTLPMILAIVPNAVLAHSREGIFFHVFFVAKTLTGIISDGCVHCISLAYVGDCIPEGDRASAFAFLSGSGSAAFLLATLSARFLSIESAFQLATCLSLLSTIYMLLFLEDCRIRDESPADPNPIANKGLTRAAFVAFFSSLSDSGLQASLQYYLKARFLFSKDQFSLLLMISSVSGTFSQFLIMPFLTSILNEERLLSLALLFSCVHTVLYSVAWDTWVPYVAATLAVVHSMVHPCIRTVVSRQLRPMEQGKGQGLIQSVCGFASVLSPVMLSPLTAVFLSETAPFRFPGFSVLCCGFAAGVAFVCSLLLGSHQRSGFLLA